MRQTYYYNDQEIRPQSGPEEMPAAPEPRQIPAPPEQPLKGRREQKPSKEHSERGAMIFLLVMVLLLGGTAALVALRWQSAEITLPAIFDFGSGAVMEPLPVPRESMHIPLQTAPTGDGTVLELLPKAEGEVKSFQTIYQEVNPSVVSVTSHGTMFSSSVLGYVPSMSQGTGVIMTENGYIITNQHVIDGAFRVDISLEDGRQFEARLVGADEATDLAVLKIEAAGLPRAAFGDSEGMVVGDAVAAIGNPMGEELRGTMTDGILSAINREIEVESGSTMTLLQTTAALNSGNSGGALVNDQGQVIGITNMKLVATSFDNTLEGLGFAIPTTTVKIVVDELIAHGHVTGRPTLGVTVQPLTPAERAERGLEYGLWVRAVEAKSDAAGKLKAGDILLSANGVKLDRNQDLLEVRDGLGVDGELTFLVNRNGERFQVTVKLVEQYLLQE